MFCSGEPGKKSKGACDFKRPVIIIKKLSLDLCIVLPLTAQKKEGSWFADIEVSGTPHTVLLYQIRTIHKKRLDRFVCRLDNKDLSKVKQQLGELLGEI